MDMFEEALAMKGALSLSGLTQSGLAREMGVSQSYVANKLRLLSLPDSIKKRARDGNISERHARAILRLSSEDKQREIIDKVIERHLTARECEALVDSQIEVKIPKAFGIRERRERINGFIGSLKSTLDSLSAIGITTAMRRSYFGNTTYITISIDEEA